MLILFANAFPFGTWEPFLEREVEFYGDFDEVIIFSLSVRDEQRKIFRKVPANVTVVPIKFRSRRFYALNSVRILGIPEFWKELRTLVKKRRLSFGRLLQLAVFLSRAEYESRKIRSWLLCSSRNFSIYRATLYSYRFLYQPFVMGRVANLFANPRIVARAHGSDLYEGVSHTGYLPLRDYNVEIVDSLSLISKHGANYIKAGNSDASFKASLDYLGTRDLGYAPVSPKRDPLRVVTCSNVVPVKRLDMVVSALSQVPPSIRVDWTHFGDGPLFASIKEQASTLGPNITVKFRGSVPNHEILNAYSEGSFQVLINSSSSEGLPVSIMEACSFGVPVIATNVGGTGEIVEDGRNGYLLPSDCSPTDIADSLSELASLEDSEYESMRIQARIIWEQRFNSRQNYANFVSTILLGDDV